MLYRFDEFELDIENYELRHNGAAQHVEPKVFDFIHFLIQHTDRVLTREEIIKEIWQGRIISDTTISSCVKSARKALGDNGEHQRYIKTTRGRGFQFVGNVDINLDDRITKKKSKPRYPSTITNKTMITSSIICGLIFVVGLLVYNQSQNTVATHDPMNDDYKIAVMPFVDLSAKGNQEYFGDGISEQVLNALTSVNQLDVTSRTTAFSLKGQNLSIPEIASKLNVNYIVEGSVRSSGNRIRITAQLIDTINDVHLWSKNYDRDLDDIFVIQDDISQQIASALQVELIGKISDHSGLTNNIDAYRYYLQGHSLFLNRGTSNIANNIANLESAIEFLEKAVALDPNFAEAWADLATSNIILPSFFSKKYSVEQVLPRAIEAADKAIILNPNLSQAFAVKSLIHLSQFQFKRSEKAILRATELSPNNDTAWLWQGLHFATVGNQAKAIEAIGNAIELAPTVPIYYSALGMFLHAKGDTHNATIQLEKAINEMGFEAGRLDRALIAIWNNNKHVAIDAMTRFFISTNQLTTEATEDNIRLYANAYSDPLLRENAFNALEKDIEEGNDTTFGIYTLLEGEIFIHDFETTSVNKGFTLARIYNPIARPLFKQKIFREYLIKIGLLSYWTTHQFPEFCRPVGEDGFECDVS